MAYPILVSLLLMISTSYLSNHVFAMSTERLIGGHFATPGTFQYHVQIIGKENFTNYKNVRCGGVAVHEYFIISVAHCFVNEMGNLFKKSYSIIAGVVHLDDKNSIKIDILTIYIPGFKSGFNLYDFSVLKLKNKLDTTIVVPADLPEPEAPISVTSAVATGFGIDLAAVNPMYETNSGKTKKLYLKYSNVNILSHTECKKIKKNIQPTQFCGKIAPEDETEYWFLEKGDSGVPLVIDNLVLGLVSRGPLSIHDTAQCIIFSKVSYFVEFAKNVIKGIMPEGTIAFNNRIHVL